MHCSALLVILFWFLLAKMGWDGIELLKFDEDTTRAFHVDSWRTTMKFAVVEFYFSRENWRI